MAKHAMSVLNVWGVMHLGIVVFGLIATAGVGAQDLPRGKDRNDGQPQDTIRMMKLCRDEMKNDGWRLSSNALQYAYVKDQSISDSEGIRNPRSTAYCFPKDPTYSEVAFYCDIYFHSNMGLENGQSVCRPEGYYLVMFKDGNLEKVPGEDVRLVPADDEPGATKPVFPGMKAYDPSLPHLPYYQAPWYRND